MGIAAGITGLEMAGQIAVTSNMAVTSHVMNAMVATARQMIQAA